MCKLFRELYDILPIQDKLIPPSLVVSFRVIIHNTPNPENFTVTGNDIAASSP